MSKDEKDPHFLQGILSELFGQDVEVVQSPRRAVYLENGYLPKQLINHPFYKVFFNRVKDDLIEGLKQDLSEIEITLRPSEFNNAENTKGLAEWIFSLSLTEEWEEDGEPCALGMNLITRLFPDGDETHITIPAKSAMVMLGGSARRSSTETSH